MKKYLIDCQDADLAGIRPLCFSEDHQSNNFKVKNPIIGIDFTSVILVFLSKQKTKKLQICLDNTDNFDKKNYVL